MDLDKTDEAVVYAREWSMDMINSDIPMENVKAIYEEFGDWIDLDDVDHIEIISIENENEDRI